MEKAFEELLIRNLEGIHESIVGLRGAQGELKDELHAAVLSNTVRLTATETRMTVLEGSMPIYKEEVKKEARRWGAVGGFVTTVGSIAIALCKLAFFPSKS